MLVAIQSSTLNLNDQYVFFPANPLPVVSMMARLVMARNPYGPTPFAELNTLELGATPISDDAMSQALTFFTTPNLIFASAKDQLDAMKDSKTIFDPLYKLANWLGSGDAVKLLSSFWLQEGAGTAPPPIRMDETYTPSTTAAKSVASYFRTLATLPHGDPKKPRWLLPAEENALCAVTLFTNFHRVINDSLFTGAIDVEKGANKNLVPVAERFLHLIALLTQLRDGVTVMRLRETWRMLESAPMKRLQQYVSPSVVDEYNIYANYVSALKVHPWLAEAERLLIPAARQTTWGMSTPTQGLVDQWTELNVYVGEAKAGAPRGGLRRVEELITTDGGALMKFIATARDLKRRRERFEPGLLDRCATILGYTVPSSPVDVHLHGDTFKAVIRTGYASDMPINDWPALMLKPNIPLESASSDNTTWGPTKAYTYNATAWLLGGAAVDDQGKPINPGPGATILERAPLADGGTLIPLYVSPQERPIKPGFGVLMTPPEALKPFIDTEYFGDYDKQFWPFTIDGAAHAMGYTDGKEMIARLDGASDRLADLFVLDGGAWVKLKKYDDVEWLFTSVRTRETWRIPVIVRPNMPTQQLALDLRSMPHAPQAVMATLLRTEDKPEAKADTLALADALATKALAGIGQ